MAAPIRPSSTLSGYGYTVKRHPVDLMGRRYAQEMGSKCRGNL